MYSLMLMLELFLFTTALSTDAFISSFACGRSKVKIPFSSVMILGLLSCLMLTLSLLFGARLNLWLPAPMTTAINFLILLGLGMAKLFDCVIKAFIQSYGALQQRAHFSLFHPGFLLQVYASPEKAVLDHSGVLSPSEAACLSLAFSLDELTAGFCFGVTHTCPIFLIGFVFLFESIAAGLGYWLGNRVVQDPRLDLSLLSSTLFIILAIIILP